MTVQQWRRVKRVFHRAARLTGSERASYLDRACGTDSDLRQEIEELLAQHERSSAFLGVLNSGGVHQLAHYKMHERIGEGGMGLVYKAEDTRLRRTVAIKALPPWAAGNLDLRARLLEEARCASALNHPNIVTIYEILQESIGDFIVMEHLAGRTLKDLIPTNGLPVDDVIRFALPVAEALEHAHANGIVHGDLKPSNVFLSEAGRIKLLDFGLATSHAAAKDDSGDKPRNMWGTSAYMAPEQHEGAAADLRADIFSFGVVLWEMFTGKHPFASNSPKTSGKSLVSKVPKKIPLIFQPILSRCLEFDPANRFQTMQQVSAALKNASGSSASASGEALVRSAPPLRSVEFQKAKGAVGRMNYESLAQSRQAADELQALLRTSDSETVRSTIMAAMRDLILSVPRSRSGSVSPPIREIRKLALELLRSASGDDLRLCLRSNDFEYLDLWNMNFAGLDLSRFSFEHCFLVESNFERCDLREARFTEAWIRNVNVANADLSAADLTDTDWFNAIGLTEQQLRKVRAETLMECPANETRMRDYLDNSYGFPMGSWSDKVREQILTAWNEYLRPGGLRDFVNSIRLKSRR